MGIALDIDIDMDIPLQITFRDMEATAEIEREVRERAAELGKYFQHIIGCRIVIEAPSPHHRHGQHYRVRLEVSVPGHELVANRDPVGASSHADVYPAIREAFDAVERELKKYVDKRIYVARSGNESSF